MYEAYGPRHLKRFVLSLFIFIKRYISCINWFWILLVHNFPQYTVLWFQFIIRSFIIHEEWNVETWVDSILFSPILLMPSTRLLTVLNEHCSCWVWGSQGADYEEYDFLSCNFMQFDRSPPTFRRNISYESILKLESICFSELQGITVQKAVFLFQIN
jgi:hypothetical protein